MVAYSFKKRFAAPILAGTKAQTIRGERKRHARPGEPVQLYTGMRTKQCRKIGEPLCTAVIPIRLRFQRERSRTRSYVWINHAPVLEGLLDVFARTDGFADIEEMSRFWFEEHGAGSDEIDFRGQMIRWQPLVPADPLAIGAAA